jgi:predicted RNase H-like nuclease (RuvC/YqgF family)
LPLRFIHEEIPVTTLRRRIVRPNSTAAPATIQRLQKARSTLDRERTLLDRWTSRLRRALNAMQKHQNRVAQLERRIRQMENP